MMSPIPDINDSLLALKQLSAKKRLDFIINHDNSVELVRSLPSMDLLVTIRELGLESSLELLEMLAPEQVQDLVDLDAYRDDQLDMNAMGQYMMALFAADADVAMEQILGLDIELMGLLFKTLARIYDTSLGEEPDDFSDLYSTSPGGRFSVCFDDRAENRVLSEALYRWLEDLYGRDLKLALRLLENVRFELASDLLEASLKWREGRLWDQGIMPRAERLKFFAPLDIKAFKKIERPHTLSPAISTALTLKPFNQGLSENFPYLKSLLMLLSHEEKEAFWQSLVHASLNMHASLSSDFGDPLEMVKVSEYVKFLAELGLFQLCQGRKEAVSDLGSVMAPSLIRLGRSVFVGLRKQLLRKAKDERYLFGAKWCHVDTPLREVALALCLAEPRYFTGLLKASDLDVRFFSSILELNASIEAIHELLFRAELLGFLMKEASLLPSDIEGLASANIVARLLVNDYVASEPMCEISSAAVRRLFLKEGVLTVDFTAHAKAWSDGVSARFAQAFGFEVEAVSPKVFNFLTTILIQLEKNWRLLS